MKMSLPSCRRVIVELDACDTDMLEAIRGSYEFLTKESLAGGRK